jgi:hypothetical protein
MNMCSSMACGLTLLKRRNELKRVRGHHLVGIHKLKLMHLGLREEDLYTLFLHHVYLNRSMEVATVEIADELYSTPHELMNWHKDELLGSTKPVD